MNNIQQNQNQTVPIPLPNQPNVPISCGLNLPPQIQDETNISFDDVVNAVNYEEKAYKIRKVTEGGLITNLELSEASEYKHKVIEKKNSLQNAPFWAQNLQTTINNIQTTLNNLQTTVNIYESRQTERIFNSYAVRDNDILYGLRGDNGQIPNNFPGTVGDLKSMDSTEIGPILVRYGLATTGLIKDKRQRLANFIGCRATM